MSGVASVVFVDRLGRGGSLGRPALPSKTYALIGPLAAQDSSLQWPIAGKDACATKMGGAPALPP